MKNAYWKPIVAMVLIIGFSGWPIAHAGNPIKIGVLAKRGAEKAMDQWEATAAVSECLRVIENAK